MQLKPARLAAGLALLIALAGCGTAGATHSSSTGHKPASPMPATTRAAAPVKTRVATRHAARRHHRHHRHHAPAPAVTTPPAPAPAVTTPPSPPPANPIPQGNAGDQDADNNGGPTDGDGSI
jgi:hypothetical protein